MVDRLFWEQENGSSILSLETNTECGLIGQPPSLGLGVYAGSSPAIPTK